MTIPMQYALRRRMMMAALGSGIDVAALSITYTGAYTDYGMVTMSDGARYRLLAFTSSGTLSIEQPVNCEVCVVGGGANGNPFKVGEGYHGYGGAGAYLKNQSVSAYNGGSVVVGAAQSVSSIGGVSVNAVYNQNGGTGGGWQYPGTGDGVSKYPFGDIAYSLWNGKPHCGGGGSGSQQIRSGRSSFDYTAGREGGTNGGNGGPYRGASNSGGPGGVYGGGSGGQALGQGGNASYYGSGAGGGGYYEYYYENAQQTEGGSGYQGIVYMRIPEEQAA